MFTCGIPDGTDMEWLELIYDGVPKIDATLKGPLSPSLSSSLPIPSPQAEAFKSVL